MNWETVRDSAFVILCSVAIVLVISTSVNSASELPDVWISSETNTCVKVLNYAEGDDYSCENLPRRYYQVWVK